MEDHRSALARANEWQRPANREVLARMIDRVDLVGIGKYVVLLVVDERVRIPTFPQLDHDFEKFIRPAVALVGLRVAACAEHLGCDSVGRRHAVPAHSALREMIRCGKTPGQIIGLIIGRRSSSDEPDAAGHSRHVGQDGGGIHRAAGALCSDFQVGYLLGQEKNMKLTFLRLASDGRVHVRRDVVRRWAAADTPGARLMPKAMHECGRQNHLIFHWHNNPLVLRYLSIVVKFITAVSIPTVRTGIVSLCSRSGGAGRGCKQVGYSFNSRISAMGAHFRPTHSASGHPDVGCCSKLILTWPPRFRSAAASALMMPSNNKWRGME